MFQRMRQAILRNIGIKITSLILALAVYAHVYSQHVHQAILPIPLQIEGLPRNLTWRGDVPKEIRIRVQATGADLLKLRNQLPKAVVHLESPHPGLLERPVTSADVQIPPDLDVRLLGLADPVVLILTIDLVASARLPVGVPLRGEPAAETMLMGPVRVLPESVLVTGARSLISQLDSIDAEEVDLTGRSESFGESRPLSYPAGVQGAVDHVSVRVPIVPSAHRSFGPILVRLPSDLRRGWASDPESVEVEVMGPKMMVEAMKPADIRAAAAPSPAPETDETAPLRVALSPAFQARVKVESVVPETVTLLRRRR